MSVRRFGILSQPNDCLSGVAAQRLPARAVPPATPTAHVTPQILPKSFGKFRRKYTGMLSGMIWGVSRGDMGIFLLTQRESIRGAVREAVSS